jgi:hypothetical protein
LNIIEKEYLVKKGWKIGYVKPSIAALRGRQFEIDNQDIYSFLTQDFAKAYKAKVIFNRFNKTINVYPISDIGKTINVEFSFRNLMNSVTITPQNDSIFTRFRVAGNNDDTTIIYYNFGSEYIENLSYLIKSGVINNPLKDKYLSYIEYKDTRREEYANTFYRYKELQSAISNINDLVPIDEVSSSWNAYSLEELKVEKGKFEQIAEYIESMYEGAVPVECPDYDTYQSIKLAILPSINEEIARQESGAIVEYEPFDYTTAWELYGISELEVKKKNYQNQCETLAQSGYDKPWSEDSGHSQGAHDAQYADYQLYTSYIEQIEERLTVLNARLSELETELATVEQNQKQIVTDVDIKNETFGFTEEEILSLNVLYIDTDFTDSSIEVIDNTNNAEVISCAKELYLSAKEQLEIESQPQWTYSISSDNPYYNEVIAPILEDAELGDFLYLELDNNQKTKQRIIKESYELIDQNDISYTIEFSNMTKCYGSADDYRFLLDSSSSSSRNSISKAESNYIQKVAVSAASNILTQYLQTGTIGGSMVVPGSGIGVGGSINISGLSNSQLLTLADMLSGLVEGTLDLDTLDVRYATIQQLEAVRIKAQTIESDLGTFKQLTTDNFTANNASIKNLDADIANIHQIFAGNVGSGTVQTFHINAENAVLADAIIKDAMIDNVSANKINSGQINTNKVTISSEDGGIQIKGNTQQWTDSDGNIRMQAGRDASGKFNFAVFGTDGKTV